MTRFPISRTNCPAYEGYEITTKPLEECERTNSVNHSRIRQGRAVAESERYTVGRLLYGNLQTSIRFDDRLLAHLQIVIGAKLRRREGFFISWMDAPGVGGGRSSVWLDSSIPLRFTFTNNARHAINRVWIDELAASANTAQGLRVTPEPADESALTGPIGIHPGSLRAASSRAGAPQPQRARANH